MDLASLRANTVFRTVSGSRAYGLDVPTSDVDRRGVCLVRRPAHYLGLCRERLDQQDSWRDPDSDTVVYEFRKAMRMFADGNPNMVELLFVPPQHHEVVAADFKPILAARDQLVTRRLARNFAGYGRHQMDELRRQRLRLSDPATVEALLGDLGERRRASFDRRLGYDTKRAMHTLRTLSMAEEVLACGEVRVARPDAAFLLSVRAGALSFEALERRVASTLARISALAEASALPEEVDGARWEALTVSTVERAVWPATSAGPAAAAPT